MLIRKILIGLSSAILLSGCLGSSNLVWDNPRASDQQFYQNRAQCMSMSGPGGQQISNQNTQGQSSFQTSFNQTYNQASAIHAKRRQQQIFDDCMRGFGWRLVPKH